jgi:hypothetical protein
MPKSNSRRKTLSAVDVDNLLCELSNMNIAPAENMLLSDENITPNVASAVEAQPPDTRKVTSPIKAVKPSQPSVDEPARSVTVAATVAAPESSLEKESIRVYCKAKNSIVQ